MIDIAEPRQVADRGVRAERRTGSDRVSLVQLLLVGENPYLDVAHLRDQCVVSIDPAKNFEGLIRMTVTVEHQREQDGGAAVLRIGEAGNLDEADRRRSALEPRHVRCEGRQHFAERLRRCVDRLAARLTVLDPLARRADFGSKAFQDGEGPGLVAGGEEAVGECEPQPRFAGARCCQRALHERLRLGCALELQEQQRVLLGTNRSKQAGGRNLVDDFQSTLEVALIGTGPGAHERREEFERAVVALHREPRKRPLRPVPPKLVGREQQAGVAGELGWRDLARVLERQVHLAGADRFTERLSRKVDLARLGSGQGREQGGRTRMVTRHRSRSRLKVEQRRIAGRRLDSRRHRRRSDQQSGDSRSCKPLTCSGNLALLRLRA